MDEQGGFLARWGRRKTEARARETQPAQAVGNATPASPEAAMPPALPEPAAPALSLADVEQLSANSDYARFMSADVETGVQRAAMKKLFFSDPHFNVMDGLDIYIDDYSQPDPIPLATLRRMHQAKALGLFGLEEPAVAEQIDEQMAEKIALPCAADPGLVATETLSINHDHAHADLRLQQDDDLGPSGPSTGFGA